MRTRSNWDPPTLRSLNLGLSLPSTCCSHPLCSCAEITPCPILCDSFSLHVSPLFIFAVLLTLSLCFLFLAFSSFKRFTLLSVCSNFANLGVFVLAGTLLGLLYRESNNKITIFAGYQSRVFTSESTSSGVKAKEHELASQPDLDKEIVDRRWDELHRKNAKLVHQHILKYRGFLTKIGALTALAHFPPNWPEPWRCQWQGHQCPTPFFLVQMQTHSKRVACKHLS